MPNLKLDGDAETFWSFLAEETLAVANSPATSQAGSSKAADLAELQPSKSIATAGMPSTTARVPGTTVGLLSATAAMPSTTAGMPCTTVETASTALASDSAHQASVSPEFSTGYTHQREHPQEQQQEQQQQQEQCNVNRTSSNTKACLPSASSDGSALSAIGSPVFNCKLSLAKPDIVDLWACNNATVKGEACTAQSGSPLVQSTALIAQSSLPTAASDAVADQGYASAAQTGHTDRWLDLSLAQSMISSARLEVDVKHSEKKSKQEETATDQAPPIAASTVKDNPYTATAEHIIATAAPVPATAETLPATAEALPATAEGWNSMAKEAAVTHQAGASAWQYNASAA